MRWYAARTGDRRTKSRFLLLPKTIDGETRWLEKAQWVQVYFDYKWVSIEWV